MHLNMQIIEKKKKKREYQDEYIFTPILHITINVHIISYAYVRYFDCAKPQKVNIMCISDYLKDGVLDAMRVLKESNNVTNNSFILLVIYENLKNFRKAGDAQLFVTGSVEEYEENDPLQTVIHELQEEIRFKTSKEYIKPLLTMQTKDEKIDWFACPFKKCQYVGSQKQRKSKKLSYSYKISCIIYGTEHEMVNIITSIPKSSIRGNDRIKGLVCMKFIDVENISITLMKRQIYGLKGTIAWHG